MSGDCGDLLGVQRLEPVLIGEQLDQIGLLVVALLVSVDRVRSELGPFGQTFQLASKLIALERSLGMGVLLGLERGLISLQCLKFLRRDAMRENVAATE